MSNARGSRLAGRRILITGAGSGIGRATAKLFASEGASLALVDWDESSLAETAKNTGAKQFVCDVSEESAVGRVTTAIAHELGGLDGVANIAGIAIAAKLSDTTISDWQRVLGVNLTGPFLICREALPHLSKSDFATIVNVSSGSAILPTGQSLSAYAASKAGLLGLTKTMAFELAPKIRVNAVCPGAIDTPPMPESVRAAANDPSRSLYALKRIGSPEEIAHAILFLTSAESSYVTGATLAVDGGRTFH